MAIVSALEYNTFFCGLKVSHTRLSHETLERILHVLRRSMWLEELRLEALGLRYFVKQFLIENHFYLPKNFYLHHPDRTLFIN